MEWKKLNKNDASIEYQRIIINGNCEPEYDSLYIELRNELINIYNNLIDICRIENKEVQDKYRFDCEFGLKLYEILSSPKFGMKEHDASNDSIWIYLQMYVIPDIVKSRVGCNEDAFYRKSNRLYLKRIWWFINLSLYENNLENTKSIILDSCNNTDTILQLVDRSGRQGYRIELYREIMKYKSTFKINGENFRKVLILNNARVKVIDPYLVNGGIKVYVKKLFEDVI